MERRIKFCLARLLANRLNSRPANRGLLVFFWIVFAVFLADAQDEPEPEPETPAEEVLTVRVTSSPATPVSGGNWILTVLIDHPVSQEVKVRPPRFPASMLLERARTEIRLIRPPAGADDEAPPEARRWTAVEFLFSLHAAGTINLEPFSVSAAGKFGTSAPVTLRIASAPRPARRPAPVFRWERPPASLKTGVEAELVLVLGNWNPEKPVPRNLFRGMVPEKFILEELPFIGNESGAVIRYPFRIIALEGENLILGPLTFEFEGQKLELPRITIPVSGGAPVSVLPNTQEEQTGDMEQDISVGERPNPFTAVLPSAGKVFFIFDKEYEKAVAEVRALWEQGLYARSLALIRAHERDRVFGPLLAPLRAEMEESLGLTLTQNESWVFWKAFLWLAGALCLAAVLCVRVYSNLNLRAVADMNALKKIKGLFGQIQVTSRLEKGFKVGIIILGGIFLFGVGLGGFWGTARLLSRGSAVLEKTEAYRVPDSAGVVHTQFNEGQPIIVRSSPPRWSFVESTDGRSGWVPAEKVISY